MLPSGNRFEYTQKFSKIYKTSKAPRNGALLVYVFRLSKKSCSLVLEIHVGTHHVVAFYSALTHLEG